MMRFLFSLPAVAVVLLVSSLMSGCGQKGALFIPGNPSEIRPQPVEQEENENGEDEEEEEEEETPR